MAGDRLTRRQRRNRVKAQLLDTLAMTARGYDAWESAADRNGLTVAECFDVAEALAVQLDDWAVRLDEGDPTAPSPEEGTP